MPAVFSYAGFRASIVHSILPSVYTDTQAIVETGCGFGRNIWDLINHGLDTDIDVCAWSILRQGGTPLASSPRCLQIPYL